MHKQIHYSVQPIQDITMTGIHWISASAGTGKTFTLSSVIVRLLLEQYLPKQIIVTTFTRKAANELRGRIRGRLQETLKLLLQIQNQQLTIDEFIAQDDPLYVKIGRDLQAELLSLNHVIERLKIILDVYDELYIGTLDSFTQKILREFAFESGQLQQVQISEQQKEYISEILHDSLRAWIEQQPQDLITYLHQQQVLQSPETYISTVLNSLNFTSAQWQSVAQPSVWENFDLVQQVESLSMIHVDDLRQIAPLVTEFIKESGRSTNKVKFNTFMQILANQRYDELHRDKDLTLLKLRYGFKKAIPQELEQQFLAHPLWAKLDEIIEQKQRNDRLIEQYRAYLQYYLIQSVQQKLSQRLMTEQETTFTEQVQHLAQAVQNELCAQVVQQRYPVILVDEFQDTNHYQDSIVQRIWRDKARYHRGCCIMVGDDKQAIYGFRGGDMLTYNQARHEIEQLYQQNQSHIYFYTLEQNHRTIPNLVMAVDALFQRNIDFGEQVIYRPIQAGKRPHDRLVEKINGQILVNHQPMRWLNTTKPKAKSEKDSDISLYAYNDLDQISWQIQHILQQSEQGNLYFELEKYNYQKIRPVDVNDIAVLVSSNNQALTLADYLRRANIPCIIQSNQSVFNSGLARDVGHVLTAILNPYREDKIKRALMTQLFACSIQKIQELEQQQKLSDYMQSFAEAKQQWQQYGFLNTWQRFLLEHGIWQNLMYAPDYERERLVINLRHITDILAHYSTVYDGQNRLLSWYQKQLNAPQEREWEIERKLSQAQGVQIMTIHKSKGLEFRLVFLMSDISVKLDEHLVYSVHEQQRTIHIKGQANEQQLEQNLQRSLSENHRLWYVALTRASYRLYLCVKDSGKSFDAKVGVNYWRLAENQAEFNHVESVELPLIADNPQFRYSVQQQEDTIQVPQKVYVQQREYSKTSFTALALGQVYGQADPFSEPQLEEIDFDANDDMNYIDEFIVNDEQETALAPIQHLFPRGKSAGTLLHGLFEKIDVQQQSTWQSEIQRQFKNDYLLLNSALWQHYQQQLLGEQSMNDLDHQTLIALEHQVKQQFMFDMQQWIAQVVGVPLVNNLALVHIPMKHKIMELKFYLALKNSNLAIKRIEQLFAEYGMNLQLNVQETARYLEGAIDMVFFDGQRYHILDYKSNYLGDKFADYQTQALAQDMTKHQYWLQASLYLVAIHRYLQAHLVNYDIEQHLGMAHYVYLRGVNGQIGQGVYSWQADIEFLLRLDALLGYHEKANQNLSV
ncbi:UvrD-helicase domain-containing protein [Moraxella sp. ZY210820]|uniref:UvrD-helicase domain-containing protein n=1 Tax=unclassified Moraxella TaxID=2685852 RepID=UPI00272FA911|nr:UvrD-helicase domain-containing protein [Moraxella sp. ZY210820]WLF83887.1 UvrD-helicase domain-containing protein [Moraxella sp. ZY210820]